MALLPCQKDAYLLEKESEVISCTKEKKGFRIQLADSILYPEGGGQPSDYGKINGVSVRDVQKAEAGIVTCFAKKEIQLGLAKVEVDWKRRYDLMQQHSAQHLITALALKHFGFMTKGFHLGERYAAIELDTDELQPQEVIALSEWVNQAIREAHPIRWKTIETQELQQKAVRSRGLPSNHTGEVRVIEIEGIDSNNCGGTHVRTTAELQCVRFVNQEKLRGRVRLSFIAGQRVLDRFQDQYDREKQLGQALSATPEKQMDTLLQVFEEQKLLKRENKFFRSRYALSEGKRLAELPKQVVHFHLNQVGLGFLGTVASICLEQSSEKLCILTTGKSQEGEGLFLIAGQEAKVMQASELIKSIMEGRGGGRQGRFQGKVKKLEAIERVLALL